MKTVYIYLLKHDFEEIEEVQNHIVEEISKGESIDYFIPEGKGWGTVTIYSNEEIEDFGKMKLISRSVVGL